jgi:adenine deaminase
MGHTDTPLRIFQQVSPLIPSFPGLELAGAVIPQDVTLERLSRENAATLGESSPFSVDDAAAERYVTTLRNGRRITGHTARLSDEPLWAYLAAGVGDDHNAVTTDEVLDRVRLGAMVTVMAGSMNDNVPFVFADLDRIRGGFGHLSFCADDKHVEDLVSQGHIDHHVRHAQKAGVDPLWAYRMGTLNPALYYRLDHLIGSITPGRLADLQLVGDVAEVRPELVIVDGEVVAEGGTARFTNPDPIPEWTRGTIKVHAAISANSFAVPADGDGAWVQAVEMYDGYFKRAFHVHLPVRDGIVHTDVDRDVLKIAVVDRHHGSETVGVGFVRGFGLRRGALAASTNCTNQNIVVLGTSDADMAEAVRAVAAMDGGYVAVADGDVLGRVALPIAGNMSDRPWEAVHEQSEAINAVAADLGCRIQAPFMIMSFVGLAGVPDFGLTELGLIETATQTFAPVVLATDVETVCCRCPSHAHAVHGLMDPATAGASA